MVYVRENHNRKSEESKTKIIHFSCITFGNKNVGLAIQAKCYECCGLSPPVSCFSTCFVPDIPGTEEKEHKYGIAFSKPEF